MSWIKDTVAKLQAMEPEWFRKSSWLNELTGGVIGTVLVALIVAGVTLARHTYPGRWGVTMPSAAIFLTLSIIYELFADPSKGKPEHRSIEDIMQRLIGSWIVIALVWITR